MPVRTSKLDIAVYEHGPAIRRLQERGIRKIAALVTALNQADDGPRPARPWTYGRLRRLLNRGAELDEMLPVRTLSEAACERPYVHRRSSSHQKCAAALSALSAKAGMDRL